MVMLYYLVAVSNAVCFFRSLHVLFKTHKGGFTPLMRAGLSASPPDHCMELRAVHYVHQEPPLTRPSLMCHLRHAHFGSHVSQKAHGLLKFCKAIIHVNM